MNKDYNLKHESDQPFGLQRARIDGLKDQRDNGEEMKDPIAKTLPMIPVTGGKSGDKFFNNKSVRKF